MEVPALSNAGILTSAIYHLRTIPLKKAAAPFMEEIFMISAFGIHKSNSVLQRAEGLCFWKANRMHLELIMPLLETRQTKVVLCHAKVRWFRFRD